MEILVNGKTEKISDGMSVKSYLESLGINPNVVACELNLTILRRAKLNEAALRDGDTLEIIQMIGGG